MGSLLQLVWRVHRRSSVAAVLGLALSAGLAGAYFAGALSGSSNTAAVAASLPQASPPTVTVTGNAAHLSWTQNTVAGSLLASYPGGGYTVQRYASTGGGPIAPASSCAGTVSGGGASLSCTDSGVPPGQWLYKITPVLNNWTGPQSAASATVTTGVATDTVTAAADPATVGTAVTYTATVTGGGATPTGTATFEDAGVAIAGCGTSGAVTLSGGVATCTVTYATVGSHTITAPYSGDGNYSPAAGNSIAETVGVGTPTDTVTSSANPANPNHAVTYTATVTGAGAGATPTGTVTFKDGGTAIAACGTSGTVTLSGGVATCTVTYTTTGSHSITAAYSGDSNYASAAGNTLTESVVLLTPIDTVTSSQNPATIGHAVTYTATVTGAGPAPTGTVTFKDGGSAIAGCGTAGVVTLSGGVATCSVTYTVAGSHSITAAYGGDGNYNAAAGNTLTETAAASSSTAVAANFNPVAVNASVTYTATVTGSGATPTGSVTFEDGASPISGCGSGGSVALTGGVATCTISYAAAGSHAITAVYGGDANYAGSTSGALSETAEADTNSLTQNTPAEGGKSGKTTFSGTSTSAGTVTVYYCAGTLSSCTSATATGSVTVTPSGSGTSYAWSSGSVTLSKGTAYTSQAYQTDPLGATLFSGVKQFTT